MRIVITGATSGIGRELALQYAREEAGAVLGLVGRRADLLEAVAAECRAAGATVHPFPVDVCDRPAMLAMAREFVERAGGVELVIANAGTGDVDRLSEGDPAPAARIFEINVIGVLNTLIPFVPAMKAAGRGQLVAIASVAGFRALPGSTAYSASKAAVRTLMEGYGWKLSRAGIRVTCINPGFIRSEMTAKNEFPMPFLLDADEAVRRIRRAIRRGRRVYTFPFPMALAARLLAVLPGWVVARLK